MARPQNRSAIAQQPLPRAFSQWLEQAGVAVPRDGQGAPTVPLEISPLFALDADELGRKVDRRLRIEKPLYLE